MSAELVVVVVLAVYVLGGAALLMVLLGAYLRFSAWMEARRSARAGWRSAPVVWVMPGRERERLIATDELAARHACAPLGSVVRRGGASTGEAGAWAPASSTAGLDVEREDPT